MDGYIRSHLLRDRPVPFLELEAMVTEELDEIPRDHPVWNALVEQGYAVVTTDCVTGLPRPEPRVELGLRVRLSELNALGVLTYVSNRGEPVVTLL